MLTSTEMLPRPPPLLRNKPFELLASCAPTDDYPCLLCVWRALSCIDKNILCYTSSDTGDGVIEPLVSLIKRN